MVYCYHNEQEMREALSEEIAAMVIARSVMSELRVCSKGKACVSFLDGMDGKTFRYADGSTDNGRIIQTFRAEINGDVIRW